MMRTTVLLAAIASVFSSIAGGDSFQRPAAFDTSNCSQCGVAEHYERNEHGDAISCKCVRNPNNEFEGDMRLSESTRGYINKEYGRKLRIARGIESNTYFHWPRDEMSGNVYIPFLFERSVAVDRKKTLWKAFTQFRLRTCIRFRRRTKEKDYLNIIDQKGCWADVGRHGGNQKLTINDCNVVGNAIHELMHTLGFFHEHTRPDRDIYVKIFYKNVKNGTEGSFDKRTNIDTGGTPYDLGSVMHYGQFQFTANGRRTVYVRKGKNPKSLRVGQRDGFSEIDIDEINRKYCPGGGYTTVAPTATGCRNHDKDIYCNYWKSQGFCKHTRVRQMALNCMKACEYCE